MRQLWFNRKKQHGVVSYLFSSTKPEMLLQKIFHLIVQLLNNGIFRFIIDDYIRRIVNNKVHFSLTFACRFFLFCFATLQYIVDSHFVFTIFFFIFNSIFENNEIHSLWELFQQQRKDFSFFFLLFISYCRFCWDCQCRKADYYQGRRSQRGQGGPAPKIFPRQKETIYYYCLPHQIYGPSAGSSGYCWLRCKLGCSLYFSQSTHEENKTKKKSWSDSTEKLMPGASISHFYQLDVVELVQPISHFHVALPSFHLKTN